MTITNIQLEDIQPNPWQTRQGEPDPEYIKGLALDIAHNGLLQIPIGRHTPDDETSVQLAFGHNRLAAFWALRDGTVEPGMDGLEDYDAMPVDLRELTDQQMADYAWSENEKRRDVSPIERSLAIQKRMESFAWSQAQVAENLNLDRSTVSNLLRLLKLPDGLRANISKGEISERQAMALLPLFEAPEHHHTENYYYDSPEKIIRLAIDGESSDRLRQKVDQYFQYVTRDLQKAEFKLDQLFTEGNGIYCGLCRTCDKRMASRNLCFMPECFKAKEIRRQLDYLLKASNASGYSISDESKGGSVTLPSTDKMATIRATGCPHLCLVYEGGDFFEGYRHEAHKAAYGIEKFPHARLVCDKRNNSCSCEKGLNIQAVQRIESKPASIRASEPMDVAGPLSIDGNNGHEVAEAEKVAIPTSSDLEEAARQARRDKKYAIEQHGKVNDILVKMLVQALKDDDPGAFYVIAHRYIWASNDDLNIDGLYKTMAQEAARLIMTSDYNSMDDLVERTNRNLARLHLQAISLSKTLVELFEEEEKANELS